ncbi:DNA polymerase III subunit gamma/tau [bacterium]|nr:DNA polymerase III subunit gamma/tau [bacterium]
MAYIVLARKWRPQTFEEVVGQEHITRTLRNAILSKRVAHAYIFSGPRGIGKTTTARLLAKALNCVKGPTAKPCNQCSSCEEITDSASLDVLEIDGASNRGIDEIRSLRENVKFAPSRDRFKVYIIDEVHMLTKEAFNALLKTLEEPPEHVKFIFATTAPHKVLPTILSRCQRFDFHRIGVLNLTERLKFIAKEERLKVEERALFAIARGGEGSMRDALSILDQLVSFSAGEKIVEEEVNTILGMVGEKHFFDLTKAIIKGDTLSAIRLVDAIISEGKDLRLFCANLIEHFRNMIMLKVGGEGVELVDLPEESIKRLKGEAAHFSYEEIDKVIATVSLAEEALRRSQSGRIPLELAVIKLTRLKPAPNSTELGEKAPSPESREETGAAEVKAETASPVPGPENTLSLEKVRENWPQVLEQVKEKKISAEAFLKEGKPVKVSERIVTVAFPAELGFHKESVERNEIRQIIEEALKEVFAHDLMIHPILKEAKASQPESTDKEDELAGRLREEPIIKTALDTFGGKIVQVKKKEG